MEDDANLMEISMGSNPDKTSENDSKPCMEDKRKYLRV